MFYGDFRWNGNLKPGIEDLSLDGCFRKYVVPFPFSSTRGALFRTFVDYLRELDSFDIIRGLFMAGSFVTLKEHPRDVDVVCCFSGEVFDGLPPEEVNRIMPFLADDVAMMKRFGVQPFPLPVYPPGHERFPVTRFAADLTIGILGTDRESSPKGMVYMDGTSIHDALTGGELGPMLSFCRKLPSPSDRWAPLYGKDETIRRQHLGDIGRTMAEVSGLVKKFPHVSSVQTLVHSLFCGLFLILGGGDDPAGQLG